MTTHQLKIEPQYFAAVKDGSKGFELRYNDRDYKLGDDLVLNEWRDGIYTGRSIHAVVVYITSFSMLPGYVAMGINVIGGDS